MESILVNTDCSVMHFLLYLTNKHMQLQESKSSTPESPKKGQAKMMNSPRGKGKKIDLEDCVTEYDIMDGDGCLIDLSSVHNKLFERVYDFLPSGHGTYTFARILRNSSTGRVVDCIGLSTLAGAVTTWKTVNKAVKK